ncbi:UNVERIFIED_CONTAM: hypothetical protein GTU68_059352, partial [Idotea baltica]|nr:hypothetical protein [Idotea baltica]
NDIYISYFFIRKYYLKKGDLLYCQVKYPCNTEKYISVTKIYHVNFDCSFILKYRKSFEVLTPLYPLTHIILENYSSSKSYTIGKLIDFIAPIGKGQRGLIVSPPKTGKTTLLKYIATSITKKHIECYLIILLIDERPEEVTEFKNLIQAEVVASTFDESPARHVELAEMILEKAKRLVEHSYDVIILLDSITRLARAYNTLSPSSGRVLSGGIESTALRKPKLFFGAGRNTLEGGSLTIIATALVKTGSKMDDIIFEEFKGTGNMELYLDKKLSAKRVYPAINFLESGTRREELFINKNKLYKMWIIRKFSRKLHNYQILDFLLAQVTTSYG